MINKSQQEREQELTLAETKIGVRFPEDIRQFYIFEQPTDRLFWDTIERINFNDSYQLIIQIDELFAKTIIETLLNLNSEERQNLVATETQGNVVPKFENIINYYLTDYVNKYNPKINKFQRKYIQSSYEKLGSYDNHVKIILLLWAHCGGWGGIILKGKNTGFNGGGMHGHFKTVNFDSIEYEYNSNYYEQTETNHIESLRREIELKKIQNGS